MKKPPVFNVGDKIAYSAAFLRSTGQIAGPRGGQRMTVTEVFPEVSKSAGCLIHFTYDGTGEQSGGVACNFTLVSRIAQNSAA